MKTSRYFLLHISFISFLLVACDRSTPDTSEVGTSTSQYYNSNTLAKTLKSGMTKKEVIDIYGEPTTEFPTGQNQENYCLTYVMFHLTVPPKLGEYTGFQVVLSSNKLVNWSLVLSPNDP